MILELLPPSIDELIEKLYFLYLKILVPFLGAILSGDDERGGVSSLFFSVAGIFSCDRT
ncbi:hypothetical protein [Thermotoga sp.]|uniref:hypothetical protein n=1 Tax=Thermotoga sp. TaxID=28240 RepID=UPI0025E6FA63|nr:hypothetical protein [Thermotoga sp.]MCD6552216.1 hypothetical protein [Thermotoga sp.]